MGVGFWIRIIVGAFFSRDRTVFHVGVLNK